MNWRVVMIWYAARIWQEGEDVIEGRDDDTACRDDDTAKVMMKE